MHVSLEELSPWGSLHSSLKVRARGDKASPLREAAKFLRWWVTAPGAHRSQAGNPSKRSSD